MFTGLIQSTGTIQRRGESLFVDGCDSFAPLSLGDSVAVDGVCLTVAEIVSDGFIANVSDETLSRSTLGMKSLEGGCVNLEPALRFSDRLGGHLVSGHVDGMGEVISIKSLKNSWILEARWQDVFFARYICDKASIAVNGISLTVASVQDDNSSFSIAVIPYTWSNTSLKYLSVGKLINLEADIIAKYTDKLLSFDNNSSNTQQIQMDSISKDWLARHGWS